MYLPFGLLVALAVGRELSNVLLCGHLAVAFVCVSLCLVILGREERSGRGRGEEEACGRVCVGLLFVLKDGGGVEDKEDLLSMARKEACVGVARVIISV